LVTAAKLESSCDVAALMAGSRAPLTAATDGGVELGDVDDASRW